MLSIFVVYAQVGHFDFVNYDDEYVYENVPRPGRADTAGIKWAFTAVVSKNWMPVTLLSHMLDVQLFGLQSGMHHLVNVVFHALSAVLLFVVLQRATRARWPSAFVAFVFALHPLHVGSVAWIAERKDVLSAFFFFLALYATCATPNGPAWGRYLLVVAPFCLGLMSKPMLVTFPFTLLLFDLWPLRRLQWPKMLWEKVPLFALSAGASGGDLLWCKRSRGAVVHSRLRRGSRTLGFVVSLYRADVLARAAGGILSVPGDDRGMAGCAGRLVVMLGVSALAISAWRTRPYFATGWFWYLGTLVPVIGLVQVGTQSHADRYMYIPMVGLPVMVAWGAADLWPQRDEH